MVTIYTSPYLSFSGQSGCYAELPLAVLAGAETFTVEVKFSTTATKNVTSTYGGNLCAWEMATVWGREIGGFGCDDCGLVVNNGKILWWCSPASAGTATSNTKIVSSSAVVNDGAFHKVAVVSSNGAIDLYCDGVNVAHVDNINAKISDSTPFYIGRSGSASSKDYLQMDLCELRFWNVARSAEEIFANITGTETGLQGWYLPSSDGLQDYSGNGRHATLYGSPSYADSYTEPDLGADVEVRVVNRTDGNYWRYENPGSGDYIYYHDNITTEQVDFDKSVTGVAFWGGDRNDMCNVPAGCKELWIRLDLFLLTSIEGGDNTTSFSFGSTSNAAGALSIAGYTNAVWVLPVENGWSLIIGNTRYFTLATGARNSILLYLRSGVSDGAVRGTVGGVTHTYTGNINNGADLGNVFFQSSRKAAMYSNIVVSNAPLTLEDGWHREPVAVELNVKAPDLCVRKNGRNYVIPFSTTNSPPAGSVVAKVGGKTVYNPLVATDDENASPLRTRCNGRDRAFSASFG